MMKKNSGGQPLFPTFERAESEYFFIITDVWWEELQKFFFRFGNFPKGSLQCGGIR